MGCVLDVFNYFFPHINVNRSSTMRSRRHLRNLQLFLCPHLINTFLILQNILLFIATEIKMNSLMSLNFHFISSISKQLYASQPWPHIKISSGLQRIPMHIPCLYVFDQNLMVVPCYWSFYRSSLSHVNVQIRAKNLSQLQEFSLPFFLFQQKKTLPFYQDLTLSRVTFIQYSSFSFLFLAKILYHVLPCYPLIRHPPTASDTCYMLLYYRQSHSLLPTHAI